LAVPLDAPVCGAANRSINSDMYRPPAGQRSPAPADLSSSRGTQPMLETTDLSCHRHRYWFDGLTVLPEAFPLDVVRRWREWALAEGRSLACVVDGIASETWAYQEAGYKHSYRMIDGRVIKERLPEMHRAYLDFLGVVRAIISPFAAPSPYVASDMNILVYEPPGACIGWHRDTNAATVLVYLTTNTEGGTEVRPLRRAPDDAPPASRIILPREGAVLLMQGRWVVHRGLPVHSEVKVACAWNYYLTDDYKRPDDFDERIYRQ
jgi:hypothetical protein